LLVEVVARFLVLPYLLICRAHLLVRGRFCHLTWQRRDLLYYPLICSDLRCLPIYRRRNNSRLFRGIYRRLLLQVVNNFLLISRLLLALPVDH